MAQARSRPRVGIGYVGPVPPEVWPLLRLAHEQGFAVSSNTAREYAVEVALAASLGWLSVVTLEGDSYTRIWNVTMEGLSAYRTSRT
jgi:hypothetical protein